MRVAARVKRQVHDTIIPQTYVQPSKYIWPADWVWEPCSSCGELAAAGAVWTPSKCVLACTLLNRSLTRIVHKVRGTFVFLPPPRPAARPRPPRGPIYHNTYTRSPTRHTVPYFTVVFTALRLCLRSQPQRSPRSVSQNSTSSPRHARQPPASHSHSFHTLAREPRMNVSVGLCWGFPQ